MSTLTVTQALANWFSKPITKLPRELRPIAQTYISQWSSLSADERRARAAEVDRQRVVKGNIKRARVRREQERDKKDPLKIAEDTIGWWDGEHAMSASFWWGQPSITPYQAALILCQYNPNKLNDADPEKDSTSETGPVEYAKLLAGFDAMERVAPAHRTLSEWLRYAKSRSWKYHTWIDEYVLAVNTLRTEKGDEASPSAELMQPPKASVTTAAQSAEPAIETVTHKLASREPAFLTVEIEQAKKRAPNPENLASVWGELSKLAEEGFGVLIGFSSDGVQYRGTKYQLDQTPDVFKRRNLRERMAREAARRRAEPR